MIFKKTAMALAVTASVSFLLTACGDGDDGSTGADGLSSFIEQHFIAAGSSSCFAGGTQIDSGLDSNRNGTLEESEITETSFICNPTQLNEAENFVRIASFPVCGQIDPVCNTDEETAAEIAAASTDGMTVIYTDSPQNALGFVDITDPANPAGIGTLTLGGEPTSVAVAGDFALVGINSSASFTDVSGALAVVDINNQSVVTSIDIGGQPDSVAVSPDGTYAAVVIENERDEELGDGAPPQAPAGSLVIVNLSGEPAAWTTANVSLTGIAELFPQDPEPEYVDINDNNQAVVSLQENNHIVIVDLLTATVVNDFSAGTTNLTQIDTEEEDPALISLTSSQQDVLREPDGVSWINNDYFVTADEGDLDGGSRGFTVFDTAGEVAWQAGNTLDHLAVRYGHYPDARSGNKGNEPENAETGIFGSERYLFVNSERSSLVFVYNVADPTQPVLKQTLPAAAGPEGALAIPSRNLLIVASEEDSRDDKLRSAVNIYRYDSTDASYPTLASADRSDGTPIPWGAMSGLSADTSNNGLLYAVEDSFYQQNRIFTIDTRQTPSQIIAETMIKDSNDVFAGIDTVPLADPTVDEDNPSRIDVFDEADLAAMINADKTINIDPEGIAKASDGGFWVASEGAGTVGDSERPVNSLNFIFKTDSTGVIENVITLPADINDDQLRFGFEGIAEFNGSAYVAFQRVWPGDTNVRIGVYDVANETWSFLFYPLDAPQSANGGWVGLSDITSLGGGSFLVIERDNQGGPDAAIKRLYSFSTSGLVDGDTVTKTLENDLLDDLAVPAGLIPEKIEGSAVMADGDIFIINDNDGVDDNSGETQLINLGS